MKRMLALSFLRCALCQTNGTTGEHTPIPTDTADKKLESIGIVGITVFSALCLIIIILLLFFALYMNGYSIRQFIQRNDNSVPLIASDGHRTGRTIGEEDS